MAVVDALGANARAVILICSTIGLPAGASVRPYGPRSWTKFTARLASHEVAGPAALVGLAAIDIERLLDYPAAEAERLVVLLDRGAQAAIELERLASRGIWALTILDNDYPARLGERLGPDAPPVLFGSGSQSLLERDGLAIVGSRAADDAAVAFADHLASAAVAGGLIVVSGGARGIDQTAMRSAFAHGGQVVGVLPDGLERRIREVETRTGLADGDLVFVSAVHPGTPFSVGAAMARNKIIYALAAAAAIASSAEGEGGTWTGAVEALKRGYAPVLVRAASDAPTGNRELIARGGIALADDSIPDALTLEALEALVGLAEPRVADEPATYKRSPDVHQEKLFG